MMSAGDLALQLARLRQFVRLTQPLALGFVALYGAGWLLLGHGALLGAALDTLGFVGALGAARRLLEQERAEAGARLIAAALLLMTLVAAPLQPWLYPVLMLIPVAAVTLATPYLTGRSLRVLLAWTCLAEAAVLTFGLLGPELFTPPPLWLQRAVIVVAGTITLGLILLLLWQDRQRLLHSLEAARSSEERLRLALEATALGTWDYDPRTGALRWDARSRELFGVPADAEVDYATFLACLPPEERERMDRAVQQALVPGAGHTLALEYRSLGLRGDRPRWLRETGRVLFEGGRAVRVVGTVLDVTEARQAEEARAEAVRSAHRRAEQLKGLTEAAVAIHGELSLEAVLQTITDRARVIIGAHRATASLAAGPEGERVVHATSRSEAHAAWDAAQPAPDAAAVASLVRRLNRPVRLTRADLAAHPQQQGLGREAGRPPPARGWLAAPLVGRGGQNLGLLLLSDKEEGEFSEADEQVLVSLAQLASVAVENVRLYQQAEEASRAKDAFLAIISHELRSPLTSMLGWLQMLRSGKLPADRAARALETVERNARAQAQLVEDLLDVSRIAAGKMRLELAEVDLSSIIEQAVESARPAADARGLTLHVDLAPDAGPLLGDATRLQQVVWNLLSNAVKFTPAGGRVEVVLRRGEGAVEVAVRDTGQGIPRDFLPHVFERFRQAAPAMTRRHGGLGLGLAIVRHLTELHGGTVRAESGGEGQGATFTVRLPLVPVRPRLVPSTAPPQDAHVVPPGLEGLRVLLVDDEPDVRELVAALLERGRMQVTAVGSAQGAWEALQAGQHDLLISDISMPEEDGYSLLARVRTLPPEQGGRVPALALTALARTEDRTRALLAGFAQHVPKPIVPAELLAAIASVSGRMARP